MVTFGDISQFAVSYELDDKYGGTWMFGKFCYWLQNNQLGDYDLGTSLRDVLTSLSTVVGDNGKRKDATLFALPTEELYNRLDSALYQGDSDYELTAQDECWARFQIHLPVDIFDDWKIYLIDSPSVARVIYKHCDGNPIEVKIPHGMFDAEVTRAFNELFKLYEIEAEVDFPS